MIDIRWLRIILLAVITMALAALSINAQGTDTGVGGCFIEKNGHKQVVPCPTSATPSGGNTPTGDNGEAARKAEADKKAAEDKAEADRLAQEAKDKKAAADRQAAFKKAQGEAVKTLKGSGAAGIRDTGTGDTDLRGTRPSGGLRDGKTPVPTVAASDPKMFDSVVANVVPKASAEVSERVRKGFQAVMNRDWKTSKAWFEDALSRDPKNLGLKRLVALADYKISTGDKMTMVSSESTEAIQEKVFQMVMEKSLNDFYLHYVPKHSELNIKVNKVIKAAKDAKSLDDFLKDLKNILTPKSKIKTPTAVIAVRG